MSHLTFLQSMNRARGSAIFRAVGVGLLLGVTSMLSLPALAQNSTSSEPSIPDYFKENGLGGARGYENQSVNEVIDTFSGKLQYHFTDLVIPGNGGMDLLVQRSYNAIDDPLATLTPWSSHEVSPVGLGWAMHFGRVIRGANQPICSSQWETSKNNPVLELPDGQRQVLYEHDQALPTMWVTKNFWRATCQAGFLHVQSPDGTTYEMTEQGHPFGEEGSQQRAYYAKRIVDRNGNTITLNYNFLPNGITAISSISTSDGRAVTFTYNGSRLASVVDTVTNRTWTYDVSGGPVAEHAYLNQVTRPDGLSWKYAYRSSRPGTGSLNRVEYPSGGSIEYTYDHVTLRAGFLNNAQSTVVRTKVARTNTPGLGSIDPVGSWTYTYTASTESLPFSGSSYSYSIPPANPGQLDTTTVEGPEPGQIVKHYHLGLMSLSGNNGARTGVGRYVGRESDGELVVNAYSNLLISNQADATGSLYGFSSNTYATVQRDAAIYRTGESFRTTRSGFDQWGNPSTVVETGEGVGVSNEAVTFTRTTGLSYDVNTSRWLIRQVSGKTVTVNGQPHGTTRTYNATNGNLTQEVVAGVATDFTYHPTGDLHTRTDALDRVTTYSSYLRGIPQTESQPENVSVSRVVSLAGNVQSETDGRGFTTGYQYDGLNRLVGITRPVGNPVTVDWTARTRKVTRGGMEDLQTMDGLGRLVRREVSATGETTIAVDSRFDGKGRMVFQSYPNSTLGSTYVYDDLDRVIEVSSPGVGVTPYHQFNDYRGLWIISSDSTGRGDWVRYRSFGNPEERQVLTKRQGEMVGTSIISALRAEMTRNVIGQLTQVSVGGKTRTYGYDSRFFLTSRIDPEIGTTTFGRDAVGNMVSSAVGSQPATIYVPDDRNRVREIQYPNSEDPTVTKAPNVVQTYNGNDLLQSVTSGSVARAYTYDNGGNLLTETLTIDGVAYPLTYGYNGNEALSSITYPSNNSIQYNPDAFGRPRAALPHVTSVSYHPNGTPFEIAYANGVVSRMEVNDRLWPSSLEVKRSSGTTGFIQSAYSYDDVGNLLSISDSADPMFERTYDYDYVNRLTRDGSLVYAYDNGNLWSVTQGAFTVKSYEYESTSGRLNALYGNVFRYFGYDSAGNVTNDEIRTYGYDRASNMRCSNCGAVNQASYTYDGANMRAKQVQGGQTTHSLHNQQGLLMTLEKPGVERKEYVYLGRRQVAMHRKQLN